MNYQQLTISSTALYTNIAVKLQIHRLGDYTDEMLRQDVENLANQKIIVSPRAQHKEQVHHNIAPSIS